MSILTYVLIGLAAGGCIGVGRVLLQGSSPGRQFIAGLTIIAGISSSLAWLAPLWILPFSRIAIVAGWAVLLFAARKLFPISRPRVSGETLIKAVAAVALSLMITLGFHYRFTEIGDSTYYAGQLVEIFKADYFGPLRIPSYYPWEMTANHLVVPMAIATMAALLPDATMLEGLEIRFILLTFAVARFSFIVLHHTNLKTLGWGVASIASALLVYHFEFAAAAHVTTWFMWMLALELGILIFWEDGDADRLARDALLILAAMAVSKTTLIFLPAGVFAWVALRFPRQAFHPAVILSSLVTVAQIATTTMQPWPFPDVSIGFSLFHFFDRAALDWYYPVTRDAFIRPELLQPHLAYHYAVGVVLVVLMILVKFWLIPIKAIDGLSRSPAFNREIHRIAEVFLLVALAGWIFLRHDQHGITHQVGIPYGAASLVVAAILGRAVQSDAVWWRRGLVLAAVAALATGYNPWSRFNWPSSPHLAGVTHIELASMTEAEVTTRRPGDRVTDPCTRALLRGMRLRAESVSRECAGTLGAIAVEPKKR